MPTPRQGFLPEYKGYIRMNIEKPYLEELSLGRFLRERLDPYIL